MFGDICAIIIVLVVLALLMQGLSIWQRKFSPHPEIVRKLVHSVMGAVTLSFPWIFQSPVSVALLGLIAGTGLTLLKRSQKLQATLGSVLCAVKRQSCGEVAFVAAIVLLFFLTHNNPLLYCIPVLILTLSDSCSALVGVFMGKHRFTTSDGTKSVEGSFAFLISTLVATAIPLFLFSSLAPANIVVIGLLLGGLVMMFEAVAWRGLDNFLIPVSSFILLSIYLDMNSSREISWYRKFCAKLIVLRLYKLSNSQSASLTFKARMRMPVLAIQSRYRCNASLFASSGSTIVE
jgi:phytol kinase